MIGKKNGDRGNGLHQAIRCVIMCVTMTNISITILTQ